MTVEKRPGVTHYISENQFQAAAIITCGPKGSKVESSGAPYAAMSSVIVDPIIHRGVLL